MPLNSSTPCRGAGALEIGALDVGELEVDGVAVALGDDVALGDELVGDALVDVDAVGVA